MNPATAHLHYSYARFALAKEFAFRMWQDFAHERQARAPTDLSGACKYGSLFIQQVFGGEIEGHYQHQFNRIGGRIVDLSHDAADVGAMRDPYLHDPDYFDIPEQRAALQSCLPRVTRWTAAFLAEMEAEACVRYAGLNRPRLVARLPLRPQPGHPAPGDRQRAGARPAGSDPGPGAGPAG